MISYRTYHEDIEAAPALRRLGASVTELVATARPNADAIAHTLTDAGELASAVLDELLPHVDDLHPAARLWTAPVTSLARASDAAWHGDTQGCEAALQMAMCGIDACAHSYVPREVTRRTSAGFASSALHAQAYAEAAREWADACQGERVVCFGLRTFGVALAAAAAAGFVSRRVDASVMTLRPRGPRSALSVVLTPRLRRAIQEWTDATFFVVDGDPEASESSMAAVARALSDLGVDDRRIVVIPSRRPTASVANDASAGPPSEPDAILAPDFDHAWIASGGLVLNA